jgi:hypothetical protein
MARTKKLWAALSLAVLVSLTAALLSGASAGAAPFAGAELEFAGDTAAYEAGEVAVPVECVGGPTGFCSGALTLSSRGRKATSTFSVQGGSHETVLVPLPATGGGRPTKVAVTATTTQPLGPAVTRKAILHLH